MRLTVLACAAALATLTTGATVSAAPAQAVRNYPPDRCTYQTISAADQRQYRSRYERRVRTQGREAAETWLRSWLCPSDARQAQRDQARQQGPTGRDGQPCRRTRTEMRAVSSGGGMSMVPVAVCAD
ncbi:hypothetical protein E4M02_00395 [Brevundimonas sp. S30B]|uniref:hypothetical protein n=1 Tax=unclassified Brevundimonas TaxID=2622653 RepID=UPI0010718BD5|nr:MULTISPECIES: hypothetical protein [unclassified Brevundimonas]QBX37616.1 hypothetical protein E4M01_07425 [Brevundimonas sp. MF30-B]TFW03591.1 hypothetical protein E4M02_00395 [Brevundimonas sp. S30B]